MKVFKELEVSVPAARRADFLARLEASMPPGWVRNREAEDRSLKTNEHAYFVCEAKGERLAALVALYEKNEDLLYVSNVVPRDISSLTHDQYNCILDEFATACVEPVAREMGLHMTRTSDHISLDDLVSPGSAHLFRVFSGLANKSTGTSHPSDKERWYDFIISVVNNDDPLDAHMLTRWLIEEDGWSEDIAHRMAIEFEMEVGLLKRYKGK